MFLCHCLQADAVKSCAEPKHEGFEHRSSSPGGAERCKKNITESNRLLTRAS